MKVSMNYFSNLWNNMIRGDKKALTLIFEGFYDELYCYGIKLTGSKDITEDSLQDLFLKLWKSRSNLSHVENIKAYLFIAFRRNILDNLKWYKKHNSNDFSENEFSEIDFSIEDILIRKQINIEVRDKLLNLLNNLSIRQKEAVYLRYFENMDFETIATIMDINVQSVRNFIHRALNTLRKFDI